MLVAAKNEEAVIHRLVDNLCSVDYPTCRYDVWVIDDNSTDSTASCLQDLQERYPQLRVVRRNPGATGGKSGALNQVWPHIQGAIIGVFDADAQVPEDMLRQVVPMFGAETVGAVQMQKAIVNRASNLLTRGQQGEMALDTYLQQQRISLGELGNYGATVSLSVVALWPSVAAGMKRPLPMILI
jgi:1,2-diacylglycerol 3-beta-glucosyltransferase